MHLFLSTISVHLFLGNLFDLYAIINSIDHKQHMSQHILHAPQFSLHKSGVFLNSLRVQSITKIVLIQVFESTSSCERICEREKISNLSGIIQLTHITEHYYFYGLTWSAHKCRSKNTEAETSKMHIKMNNNKLSSSVQLYELKCTSVKI